MAPILGSMARIQLEGHSIEDLASPTIESYSTPLSSPLPPSSFTKTPAGTQKHIPTSLDNLALRARTIDPNSVQLSPSLRVPLEYAHSPSQSKMSYNSGNLSLGTLPGSSGLAAGPADQYVYGDVPPSARTPRAPTSTPAANSDSQDSSQTITHDPRSRHVSSVSNGYDNGRQQEPPAPESPCFVHSLLDRGASLRNWLELNGTVSPGYTSSQSTAFSNTPHGTSSSSNTSHSSLASNPLKDGPGSVHDPSLSSRDGSSGPADASSSVTKDAGQVTTAHFPPQHHSHRAPMPRRHEVEFSSGSGSGTSGGEDEAYEDDERDDGPSLTKQLAETAVGVRELSKQLG